MDIRSKVITGAVWSLIQGWGSYGCTLIIFLILSRLLTPEDFGTVALANSILALLQIFLDQGLTQALIQRERIEDEHLNVTFWTVTSIGVFLSTITGMGGPLVAAVIDQPLLAEILQSLSVIFVFIALSRVQQALLEREFAFKKLALRSLLSTLVGGTAGITAALHGYGVWSLVIQTIATEFTGTLVLWLASPWRPRVEFSMRHFKQLSGFGLNVLGANFLGYINNNADDLLIGLVLGTVPLGYYTIAYRILSVMTHLLIGTSQQVALPAFSRVSQDLKRFGHAFYSATQLTSVIAFPFFLGAAVLAEELVVLCFGSQWQPSIAILQVLAIVGLLRSITYFKGAVFLAANKPDWKLRLACLSTSLNLIGFLMTVHGGIVAVATAYLCRAIIMFPISQWLVGKLLSLSPKEYIKQFIAPLTSSLIMISLIWIVKLNLVDFLNLQAILFICILFGSLVYVTLLWLFDRRLFTYLVSIMNQLRTKQIKPS